MATVTKTTEKKYNNENEVGAIWNKEKGLSVQFSKDVKAGERAFAFPNKLKTKNPDDRQPDYRLVKFKEE